MGAGKTTVGSALATRLDVPLRDSDADLLALTGDTTRELRTATGVNALHALEAAHLLTSMAAPDGAVICAAAAVADDPRCVEVLRLDTRPGGLAAGATSRVRGALRAGAASARLWRGPGGLPDRQAARASPSIGSVADLVVVQAGPGSPRAEVEVILAALRA